MKIREGFKGIFCLPVTPFKKDDEVDEEALRSIVDLLIDDGVDGLVPTGATGEFPYLIHEERKKVQDIVIDQANGRVPVLAGTGATTTKEALIFTQYAKDIGCDGVMLSHPILARSPDERTYEYFEKIATKVEIPILLYNNPHLGQGMSPQLVAKLATDFDNVVSHKDDNFEYHHFAEVIRLSKDKVTIFTGSPAALFAFLQLGAHGALVAEFQAFPHLVKGVYESFNKGDLVDTLKYHEKIMTMFDIIRKHFGMASFAGRYKAILNLRGIDINLAVRHPNLSVTPEQLKNAEPEFMELGLEKIN